MERHILVVGGTRGIGRAFTQVCSGRGWKVSLIARTSVQVPDGTAFYPANICSSFEMEHAVRAASDRFGPIHAAAFFQRYRGSEDVWTGEWATSVKAIDSAVSCMLPFMATTGDRSIVIISSSAATFVAPEQNAAYHASRSAQLGLMRYLAVLLGRRGIRVNCVSPGTVLKEENAACFGEDSEKQKRCAAVSALGRMGSALEVASTAEFLCSDRASWMTGQNLICDGGASLLWPESFPPSQAHE